MFYFFISLFWVLSFMYCTIHVFYLCLQYMGSPYKWSISSVLPVTAYKCFSYVVMICTCVLASVSMVVTNWLKLIVYIIVTGIKYVFKAVQEFAVSLQSVSQATLYADVFTKRISYLRISMQYARFPAINGFLVKSVLKKFIGCTNRYTFTVRRFASGVYATANPSVRLSVRPSVCPSHTGGLCQNEGTQRNAVTISSFLIPRMLDGDDHVSVKFECTFRLIPPEP